MWDKKEKKHIGMHDLHPESLMMSYGYRPEWSEGAVKPPIFQTSTFVFKTAEEGKAFFEIAYGLREKKGDETLGLIYSRLNNPGLEILEDRLTIYDGAEAAAAFESGMAAITTTAFTFLRPGDVVAFSEPIYGGTEYLFHEILPAFGVETVPFRASGGRATLETALDAGKDRRERLAMIYVETPANPTNDLVDIAMCAEVARACSTEQRRVLVAVDNTFLGPLWQHPLKHGADLVLYSLTKFVGGHSDLIAGACLGTDELVSRVKATRTFFGSMAGPWTGWLLLRSLETLKLRMTSQMKNARYVADFLADHPKVAKVHYLGLMDESHPDYAT
ncbi:MAG TPA: aminotransferase class I/II-fold pyridoxal phosphate-dependent enzyme, partial [Longimicrobiales bacterium]|nr:aminotransferase class I/II-fold pyridoxal phosphate-dependent enzyme [Longimicrobiales bacterium]